MLLALSRIFVRDDTIEIYYELQKIENTYIESKTIMSTENIKLNHN